MFAAQILRRFPILVLLLANMLVGLFTFRDYGLSWDEPLFYDYADALRYAYSPREWLDGDFDLNRAFGASGSDHANRGPAYIILARPFVSFVEFLGADNASAWHLVNFLTFQLGVYLFYRLARRFVGEPGALASVALFAWQPLLWGHAFVNPKDPPFLVFFLGAVLFGFELVDCIKDPMDCQKPVKPVLLASFFLGVAASIRVLGPLAGGLVGLYALGRLKEIAFPRLMKFFAVYAALAVLVSLALWPYLWGAPLQRFVEVFGFMSDNPTHLPVLFNGQTYPADQLPRRYFPVLLTLTLTEPVFPLFILGLFFSFFRKPPLTDRWLLIIVFLWFLIPFSYVLLRKPPMYDGYRHFLFVLPPLFIFAGFAFDVILSRWWSSSREAAYTCAALRSLAPPARAGVAQCRRRDQAAKNLSIAVAVVLLTPALYSAFQLHPYQYAYYNSFIGGADGAFRKYETEYWLTCYKEAIENFDEKNVNLFVKREPYIAGYYAEGIEIRDYRAEFGRIQPGDYVLVNTRTNEDIKTFRDAPVVLQVARAGAIFCEVKRVP